MNKVLKFLTVYDIFALGGLGLITPIFAIFINDRISGGSVLAAGIATTIFELTKAAIQVPVSRYTDWEDGNKREFYTLLFGSTIVAIVPLIYLAANNINEIYIAQFLLGVGGGFSYPGWMTIFTRFTEKNKEGRNWSYYNTYVTLALATSAVIGGFIAQNFGFKAIFMLLFIFALISIALVLKAHKHIFKV